MFLFAAFLSLVLSFSCSIHLSMASGVSFITRFAKIKNPTCIMSVINIKIRLARQGHYPLAPLTSRRGTQSFCFRNVSGCHLHIPLSCFPLSNIHLLLFLAVSFLSLYLSLSPSLSISLSFSCSSSLPFSPYRHKHTHTKLSSISTITPTSKKVYL